MNLKQITDKLNSEFIGDVRKLIFWYDDNAEFKDDVDTLELNNAKVLHLEKNNQFYIKHFLERVDRTTNYLVYAPFAEPNIGDNHLADMIRYSKKFYADRVSLLVTDLGINEKYKMVIQNHIKFFDNKDRTQRFYNLKLESFNESIIEVAMMSVLCKSKTASFEEVLRCILTDDGFENNRYLAEFKKYDLLTSFWKQVNEKFGYDDNKHTLEKLIMTMFVTYTSDVIHTNIPEAWEPFISSKPRNVIHFLDDLMNSNLYSAKFDEISGIAYRNINGKKYFEKMKAEALVDCNVFLEVDEIIIKWLIERLEIEDTGANLNGKSIPEICAERRKKHFGEKFRSEYFTIENAYYIISDGVYSSISGISNIINKYTESLYKIDRRYRYFYYYFDQMEDTTAFEKLRDNVENIYTNEYLNKIIPNWNKEYTDAKGETGLPLQRRFFKQYVNKAVERTVVIISDALRYEVAYSLFEKLQADEKCTVSISTMQGVLPSYTPLGMAALLPHKTLEFSQDYNVLIDGKVCVTTEQREALLKEYIQKSKCIQFDTLKSMKRDDLRSVFTGMETVYVYHNQIDARGDAAKTENEVFEACEEAIKEIFSSIKRISSQANTHRFIITADHGFIYKRDKIQPTDKIKTTSAKSNSVGQRYVIANEALNIEGVCNSTLGTILGNDDNRVVSYPIASNIFKVAGAGQNFVHGGCSPQETLIPLIDVKVDKGKKETRFAEIALISITKTKITNLITTLDFVQTEPVSDVVKETTYKIYFISDSNERISNEIICIADKKDNDTVKRMFKFRFTFKDQKYNKQQKYYLVIFDNKNDIEIFRQEVIMDIAFADDFGFFS